MRGHQDHAATIEVLETKSAGYYALSVEQRVHLLMALVKVVNAASRLRKYIEECEKECLDIRREVRELEKEARALKEEERKRMMDAYIKGHSADASSATSPAASSPVPPEELDEEGHDEGSPAMQMDMDPEAEEDEPR